MRKIKKEWKEKINNYLDQLEQEEREKQMLLNSKADFGLLEKLIQKSNENPNLKIEVFLNDGTRLLLKTYEEKKLSFNDLIETNNYEEVR